MQGIKKTPTDHEVVFVNGLGRFSKTHDVGRVHLLRKYRESLEKRKNWDGIDKRVLIRHVDAERIKMIR